MGPDGGSSIIFSLSQRRGGQLADHRTAASERRWQGWEWKGPRGRAGCPRPCPLQEAFSLQPNTRSHLFSDVHHVIFDRRYCEGALENIFACDSDAYQQALRPDLKPSVGLQLLSPCLLPSLPGSPVLDKEDV
ncbi:hypothetical protein HispidOSU_027702 [Sigmodon hispidus]